MRVMRVVVIASIVFLLAGACSEEKSPDAAGTSTTAATAPSGPQKYTVIVDGPSTLGAENYVFGTYFPNNLNVRPGDTITYDNRSSNDIHTVTFGVKQDRSDQPPTVLKSRQANPVVFGPCYTTTPAKPDLTCPPPTAGAPEYGGKGYWNSGVIMPTALPPEAGPKTTTVKFGSDIASGTYVVTCLLHPNMSHNVTVVSSDAERQSPAQVAATADKELSDLKAQGTSIVIPTAGTGPTGASVASGWSNKIVAVNRFYPETVAVKAGQTVTWKTHSDWMPHTVSFAPPFKSPAEPDALKPSGVESGGKFDGGESHSGIFGPPPDGLTDTFALTFTKPGKYPYLCLLHPGMAGTVEVS
ncbi:MAG TPA: plastocyanin/azurin family copper-binding protein [Acidimicrobiia bacterium]|nr:plastocyanin/azurin family copper-binding protein [Acidimicrobiia bacterium]